ncbi:MAG: PEP-CTERM/exosortase system-associated acyltransferase [Methylococcales bacterium]|nr:PEP-CTERM/exosortase system-associated acyltransferase [Methylococcales bacterium]
MANTIEVFNEYFEMVPATSDELKDEVYKLRYQVYCIETEFLNFEHYPDGLEFDEFDDQSLHYLIRHRKSGEYAATTRLVLPVADNPEKLFPLEIHCEVDNVAVMRPIDRRHLGEISRFCVSKAFKRRKNEAHTLAGIQADWKPDNFTLDERRTFPHISLALMVCVTKASYENDIYYAYAAMEPALLRFLSTLGINLIKIGPLGDYHGERWPALIKAKDMQESIHEKNPDIWELLTNKGCFWQARPHT